VRAGTDVLTGRQVAIKVIRKRDMKPIEVYQQRREIDVLKACQHDNLIQLVDLFESASYYYIVLEHMRGKDLFDYLKNRNFKLPEERVRDIMR
jgi:MAP/microtubule affinity-regulating kinase